MEYTTQMDAARKGIFTPEMAKVAEKEHLEPKKLMALMAEGKVIIPCNKVHTCIEPNGLGSMLKTKINVNLGTSRDLTRRSAKSLRASGLTLCACMRRTA